MSKEQERRIARLEQRAGATVGPQESTAMATVTITDEAVWVARLICAFQVMDRPEQSTPESIAMARSFAINLVENIGEECGVVLLEADQLRGMQEALSKIEARCGAVGGLHLVAQEKLDLIAKGSAVLARLLTLQQPELFLVPSAGPSDIHGWGIADEFGRTLASADTIADLLEFCGASSRLTTYGPQQAAEEGVGLPPVPKAQGEGGAG